MSTSCPIGPLGAHTWNYERTECIWCGPGRLASRPGVWRRVKGGFAWQSPRPASEEGPSA